MLLFPVFMAGSMGLSFSNTRAVFEAVTGKQSAFVRTPKYRSSSPNGTVGEAAMKSKGSSDYVDRKIPRVVWVEVGLLAYSVVGLVWLIISGNWIAVPFQALLASGFGLVVAYSLHSRRGRLIRQ